MDKTEARKEGMKQSFYGMPCEGDFSVETDELNDREVIRLEAGKHVRFPLNVPVSGLTSLFLVTKSTDPDGLRVRWGNGTFSVIHERFNEGKWCKGAAILPGTMPKDLILSNEGSSIVWVSELRLEEWEPGPPSFEVTNLSILVVYRDRKLLENVMGLLRQMNSVNGEYGQIFVSATGLKRV